MANNPRLSEVSKDTQFKKGNTASVGYGKPKGSKHLSTWIQQILNDPKFELENFNFKGSKYQGAPIKAIITVAIYQALQGDAKWAAWLAKYGYGDKLDITSNGQNIDTIVIYRPNKLPDDETETKAIESEAS